MSIQGVDKEELLSISEWVRSILDDTYEEIKHGDEAHQQWLRDKIDQIKARVVVDEKEGCVTILPNGEPQTV